MSAITHGGFGLATAAADFSVELQAGVVQACGPLDALTVELLLGVARNVTTHLDRDVTVDLAQVTHIDSDAIHDIFEAQHDYQEHGIRLRLRVPSQLRTRLSVCDLEPGCDAGSVN